MEQVLMEKVQTQEEEKEDVNPPFFIVIKRGLLK